LVTGEEDIDLQSRVVTCHLHVDAVSVGWFVSIHRC